MHLNALNWEIEVALGISTSTIYQILDLDYSFTSRFAVSTMQNDADR